MHSTSMNDWRHGVDCQKVPHIGTGHLHMANDDTPYDVDGVWYCGRCHVFLPKMIHEANGFTVDGTSDAK